MGRPRGVRFFESKNAYFTMINGKRYRLGDGPDDFPDGPQYRAAQQRKWEIETGSGKITAKDDTVRVCCERWKTHLEAQKKASELKMYSHIMPSCLAAVGHLRLSEVSQHHVDAWLAGQTKWKQTTKGLAFRVLRAALGWNVAREHTTSNPFSGRKALAEYRAVPRGASFALDDSLIEVLLDAAGKDFRDYLISLIDSGARPGEMANATPGHYDRTAGTITFRGNATTGYKWKNATKHGKDRIIHLTPRLIEIIDRRISRQGASGLIFRTEAGKPFGDAKKRGGEHMWRLRRTKKVGGYLLREKKHSEENVILYALRHTFGTRAVKKVPVKILADIMGTSVAMIEKFYGHSDADVKFMRESFDKIHA